MNEVKSKLRKLRLIQFTMIAAIPMFGWVAESIGRGSSDWTLWHWVMTGLALYAALAGLFFRRRLMDRSQEAFAKDASNPKALKQWEAGHLIGLASAEAVVVWGVAVRMVLGGALWQASLFYAAGLILLLLWTPRMPNAIRDLT
jgi:F0F1-type ATP synthase membrane subunit c/vacuolar-type H+-ATPase subunit K